MNDNDLFAVMALCATVIIVVVLIGAFIVAMRKLNERGERDVIDVRRFSDFYAMVQQVGAECGVWVPDPDPLHFYEKAEK